MNVYVNGSKLALNPSAAIGKGGEADVYAIAADRVLKLFKPSSHPDYAHSADEQRAAKERLDVHQHKLPAFPRNLPPRVVAPEELATSRKRGGRIVGYTMRRVQPAELLYHYGDAKVRRRGISTAQRTRVLRDLHDSVSALHRCGVVIGDFNDLNVLVSHDRAYLIDADSYQFGGFVCGVFSERFVDPLHCDASAAALVPSQPHSERSDWYAYAAMVLRTLLFVGPYGGVYKPRDKANKVGHTRRPFARITVFHPEVVYPKPATHFRVLPDELLDYLEGVFVRDHRGALPTELLDELRWTECTSCGLEHARDLCPACALGHQSSQRAALIVRGQVTVERVFETAGTVVASAIVDGELRFAYRIGDTLFRDDGGELLHGSLSAHQWVARWRDGVIVGEPGRACVVEPGREPEVMGTDACADQPAVRTNARHRYWLDNGRLVRDGDLGTETLGAVLSEQTRFWSGEHFGFGFYRAGGLSVAFCFDAEHRGINDRIALTLRGQLVDAHCSLSADTAWLFTAERRRAGLVHRCQLFSRAGALLASAETTAPEGEWLHAGHTSCAAGRYLFVATDSGIVRVERDGAALTITRQFPDTAAFVDAATQLHIGRAGLFAVKTNRILRIGVTP